MGSAVRMVWLKGGIEGRSKRSRHTPMCTLCEGVRAESLPAAADSRAHRRPCLAPELRGGRSHALHHAHQSQGRCLPTIERIGIRMAITLSPWSTIPNCA